MSRDWETTFAQWARPPGKSENRRGENAITAIRNAISRSSKLRNRGLKVFPQGSYRNRVNVRQDSDVDVGVLCGELLTSSPARHVPSYPYTQFKNELEEALVAYFRRTAVHRGNKAINLRENSYHVEADVAPFFEYRYYFKNGSYRCGVAMRPDNGGLIYNYPERLLKSWPHTPLHYENGVSKNKTTSRSYKSVVRIVKTLRNEMEDAGMATARPIPGFLVECLVWNAPNVLFTHRTWDGDVQTVFQHIWINTKEDAKCANWCEVNGIKYLFHNTQPWSRSQAHAFIEDAWKYVGVRIK